MSLKLRKKVMLPTWQTYKRENPWQIILFLPCRIPDTQIPWIIIKFYFCIFISCIQECTGLWLKYDIQFTHFSSTKKAIYIAPSKEQRITYLKTNKWPNKMSEYHIISMVSACVNTAKWAAQNCFSAKILCMFFRNAYENK